MVFEHLIIEKSEAVALLTINREKALNALTPATLDELGTALERLERDTEVKVVVITGSGTKAFVAGGDIAAMQPLEAMAARDVAVKAQTLFNAIETGRKIYIAAINGYALGAGCELAMACDIRIAADSARLGQPEVRLGIIPGWGGTQRLPRLIGKGRAKEIMMTGRLIEAAEAERIGLVNRVVGAAELMAEARTTAAQIADQPQRAVRLIKEAVDNGMEMDIGRAFAYEADLFGLCFSGEDQKEGMKAFLEKRKPVWKDR